RALRLRHDRTGADILFLLNDDDNKVFMASFRTPPQDDAGVPHILEHSVLNGSRKYPLKEPFAELLKCSLNTFLNAFTYNDRTVYPVASRNHEDFRNLMDVYLDACFYPTLARETFLQEGWHYHADSADEPLSYTGIVYNEMLGAYSDPESLLGELLYQSLYPDSIYALSSGGDPEAIPTLTYEAFCDFHASYYHPSNARFLLAGDLDVDERLAHLAEYLDGFEAREVDSVIQPQPPLRSSQTREASYAITEGEDPQGKTYALWGWTMGSVTDAESYLACSVLARILNGTPASPLRKALIESGLGESTLDWGFDGDLRDTNYSIGLKGTDPDKVADIATLIEKTLGDLVGDGISTRMVEAAINTVEFHLREANLGGFPKNLYYGLMAVTAWNYDADPLTHLRYEQALSAVRAGIGEGRYFEQLIDREMLRNPHRATIVLTPDDQAEVKRLARLRTRLDAEKAAMSAGDIATIVREADELRTSQLEPDPPEALACMPVLARSAISAKAQHIPYVVTQTAPYTLSWCEQPTRGIAYVKVLFDASGVPQDLLPYLGVFGQLCVQVGTANRDYVNLTEEIGIHTGGIGGGYSSSGHLTDYKRVNTHLGFGGKALCSKVPELMGLIAEIVSDFKLDNLDRVREIVSVAKSAKQSAIVPSGNSFVSARLGAAYSTTGMHREITSGLTQYYFLEHLVRRLEVEPHEVLAEFRALADCLFRVGGMQVHVTGSDAELAACQAELGRFTDALVAESAPVARHQFEPIPANEGWSVPSKVQYVGKAANLYALGLDYHGSFAVLDTLLSRGYLWDKVRVQGAAYGCSLDLDFMTGTLCCLSYRDPNLARTLQVFDEMPDWLASQRVSESEYDKLVIGTMGTVDSPRTASQIGAVALRRALSGISGAEVQKRRDEILGSSSGDLLRPLEALRAFTEQGRICVIGGDEKLQESADCFAQLRPVFE
ncbi:MAG: Zn-dependent M16 (insulinase) family peptidase, partial [Rhodothermales bacterium]